MRMVNESDDRRGRVITLQVKRGIIRLASVVGGRRAITVEFERQILRLARVGVTALNEDELVDNA